MKDYYAILGVGKQASGDEIKKAYRKLAKRYHPDAIKGDAEKNRRMYEIQEAYQCLGNTERRKKYDMECSRAAGMQGGQKSTRNAMDFMNFRGAAVPPAGKAGTDTSQFERIFGFSPQKGSGAAQPEGGKNPSKDKNSKNQEGPIRPDELFASFFGKMT